LETLGHYTHQEILSQPEAWRAALEVLSGQAGALQDFYRRGQYDTVLFTGCGSTYYLAVAAATLLQEVAGIEARGLPASEIWLYPNSAYSTQRRTLLVAVSRSGETTETIQACSAFRARANGDILTLSCYPDRPLTSQGRVNLLFPSSQEQSLAQTRAFSTLYLATVALAAMWAGDDKLLAELSQLPTACQTLISTYQSLAHNLGSDSAIERFYFLGSGPRYGLACELSLKMKEMSLSHSEPFHFMEFRHGPRSMVTPETLVVGLVSEANRVHELAVLEDMRVQGGRILAMAERDGDVNLASGIGEAARNVLYLPISQLLAFERAVHKGFNPDQPHNLVAVVRLDQ
jgi:glucosamine--fructose-6-phosphate aminotransferase (isomerizing)